MRFREIIHFSILSFLACSLLGEPATWFAIAYAFFVISIALTSYGYSQAVAKQQAAKAKKNALKGAGYLGNYRDTQVPIFLIYGKHKVGCNQVFVEVKDDHTLCFIGALGEGPIKGIDRNTGDCLGIKVSFGEKHLHLFHGFDSDEYDNFNYCLGNGTQNHLPVYEWDNIDEDPMRYTAYMGFRLHWNDQGDFDSLGGFPITTAVVEGLVIDDPRFIEGHEGMMWGFREHQFTDPDTVNVAFSKISYAGVEGFDMTASGGAGLAAGHLFHEFPRAWLEGKRVNIKWRATQAGGAPIVEDVARIILIDGTLSPSCDGHFPPGSYETVFPTLSEVGVLQTTGIADPWREDTFVIDLGDPRERNLTLDIMLQDNDVTRNLGVQIAWIKIKDAAGTTLVWEEFTSSNTLNIISTGTTKDYGTWNISEVSLFSPIWTDNPALVLYDVMRNERYGGGIPEALFDMTSVCDAANWCDNQDYHFNGVIYEQDYLLDIVSAIASTFRMVVIFSGGLFKFICLDYEVPVMTFTEKDIRADSFRVIIPSAQDVPTQVRMKFPNASNYYGPEDLIVPGAGFIAGEGEIREKEIQGFGLTDYRLARRLAAYQLERAYYSNQYFFTVGMEGYPLEAGDVIAVSHPVPGWAAGSEHNLRLTNVQYMPQGEVALVGILEYESLYDDTVNMADEETYDTSLPGHNPDETADDIPAVTAVSYTISDRRYGRTRAPVVVFTFTLPEYVKSIDAWYSPDGEVWAQIGSGYSSSFWYAVTYNEDHYFRLCSVMPDGRRMDVRDAANWIVVVGGPEDYQDIIAVEFLSAGDFVNVYSNPFNVPYARKADKASIDTTCHGFVDKDYWVMSTVDVRDPGDTNLNLSGLVTGNTYYLGSNGEPSATPAVNPGEINQTLGVALSETSILFYPSAAVVV